MACFEALVSWYNDVVGTQKLVCSYVLGQTQWWSLIPKSPKNFACPTVHYGGKNKHATKITRFFLRCAHTIAMKNKLSNQKCLC